LSRIVPPRRLAIWLLAAAWLLCAQPAMAALFDYVMAAPKGSLMIVGGGDTPAVAQEKFVALSGGAGKARIAILPMASMKFDEEATEVMADFRKLGTEVQLLEMSREEAQQPSSAERLASFDGYWFTGGDQSRLAALLGNTVAIKAIERRYHEGAVVGGTSAGAAIMSAVMLTGRWRSAKNGDESEFLSIAKGMKEVSSGFGFFKGAIVDQHFMKRARYNRLLSAVLDNPQLIGVGIDEETALLVRPDGLWEVLGNHYVKIFDARRARIIEDSDTMAKASDIRMHVLPAGSTFDPGKRKVVFPTR